MKKYFALTVCALITTLLLTTGFTWNSGGPGESAPTYVIDVADRPAQFGDTLLIDYKGIMNGNEMEGGIAFDFSLTLGSGLFIDGFEG